MAKLAISFLIMMNPFAQFLYLKNVADELDLRTFAQVYSRASIMSFVIYVIFSGIGEGLFTQFFNITFESFRIFGGIIIFSYAFLFIMNGAKGLVQVKENLDDLASEIALPFIVGAGTIYLAILIGLNAPNILWSGGIIGGVMVVNFLTVLLLVFIKELFRKKRKVAFDKYVGIAMRLNAFFMGAIGVNMVVEGILSVF
jgi:multiple antibiotic resistance protein